MRSPLLVAACATVLAGPIARQAAAQEPPASGGTGAPVIVEPVPAAPPAAPDDQARVGELHAQLFATQALSVDGGRVTRNGIRIDATSFYTLVGRADLADQVHTRRATKGILIGAGATALTFGVLIGLGNAVCIDSCGNKSSALPGGLLLGGAAAILIGALLPSDPASAAEKAAMVDDYNRRLRASVGLAP